MSSTAQARLDLYLAAEAGILQGQSVSIDGRSLTRASLNEVRRAIIDLQRQVAAESRTQRGPRHVLADFQR